MHSQSAVVRECNPLPQSPGTRPLLPVGATHADARTPEAALTETNSARASTAAPAAACATLKNNRREVAKRGDRPNERKGVRTAASSSASS